MKIRIRFRKWGVMKFVGHLDMMRYFQKAIRRAEIDIAYSAGYSPHQIMSFASPLGVGITSDGEYFDIEVHSTRSSKAAVAALNAAMVDGVEVVSYRLLPEDAKNAMSIVDAADYQISFTDACKLPSLQGLTELLLAQTEIPVLKKTKKSETAVDLKPMVMELKVIEDRLFMRLSSGSSANCKPIQVLEAMTALDCGTDLKPVQERLTQVLREMTYGIQVHRLQLYANTGSEEMPQFITLEDLGEEIG